jgi:hypothetical protein
MRLHDIEMVVSTLIIFAAIVWTVGYIFRPRD